MRKLYIVKNSRDFEYIINNGKLAKNRSYVLYYIKNKLPYSRFGISVGKKIGNAVTRNKYKRKLRSIIDNSKNIYINNRDYIIILRGSAKEKDYHELERDFISLITSIRKEKSNEEKQKQE